MHPPVPMGPQPGTTSWGKGWTESCGDGGFCRAAVGSGPPCGKRGAHSMQEGDRSPPATQKRLGAPDSAKLGETI